MKKFFKTVSFFVLMILLLLPISSCGNDGFDEDNTPIEWGFDIVSGGGNDDGEPDIAFTIFSSICLRLLSA